MVRVRWSLPKRMDGHAPSAEAPATVAAAGEVL
jgi:hypothetical protein